MYIFNDRLHEALARCNGDVTPLEPPYIQVNLGRHISKQKLGSYLTKAYPDEPKLVKELVEEYKEINGNLDHYRVEHTTDYVEIYQHDLYALDSTCKSCMTDSSSVRIYNYDERLSLLVAYKDSKLVLRTLVRMDKMEYVRLYIDHNFVKTHIAKAIVAKAGYTEGNLEGIKLDFIEENDGIVCPYLDKVSNFDIVDEYYLIIRSRGEFDGSTTVGYVDRKDKCTCDRCGDWLSIEEAYCVEDEYTYCENCFDRNYIIYNGESYRIDNCVTNNSTNELIPIDCIDDADISCTDGCEWYNSDEVICINDCNYHESECTKLVQEDEDGNEYALNESVIFNPYELDMLASGHWLREQIVDVLDELKETLDSLQTDLFDDKDIVELSSSEIDNLTIEITKIEELL